MLLRSSKVKTSGTTSLQQFLTRSCEVRKRLPTQHDRLGISEFRHDKIPAEGRFLFATFRKRKKAIYAHSIGLSVS